MSSAADAQSAFFQRMTGLGFAIMSLGYAKCGVSKDAWIKQTMLFHVISTPIFFLQCASDDGSSFTPWVWYRRPRRPFIFHAIDATCHHGSARSPNRHQHRACGMGIYRDGQEQDEVGLPARVDAPPRDSQINEGECNPAAPHPSDS